MTPLILPSAWVHRWRSAAVLGHTVLACLTLAILCGTARAQVVLRLASGPESGVYAAIGREAAEIARAGGLALTPVATNGSWQNLVMLDSLGVQFALTQKDALVEYLRFSQDSGIVAVQPLYEDYLHILVRSQFSVSRVAQFQGLRIFPGLPQSGTGVTTHHLLDVLGISTGQFDLVPSLPFDSVEWYFRNDSLDVATYVGGLGNKDVADLMRTGAARLFAMDKTALKAIMIDRAEEQQSGILIRDIPPGVYVNQPKRVQTIATPVLLVTNRAIPDSIVRSVVFAVDSAIRFLNAKGEHGEFQGMLEWQRSAGVPLYVSGRYWPTRPSGTWIAVIVAGLIVVLLAVIVFRFRLRLYLFFRAHPGRGIAALSLILCLAFTFGAFLAESAVNDNFSNFGESLWSVVVYLVSGMENRAPVTKLGRVFCLAALFLGPLVIALMTGFFASTFVVRLMEAGMPKHLRDHFVIANWNSRAYAIIEQLRSPILERSVIAVISDDPGVNLKDLSRQFARGRMKAFEDVYFCPGDPSTKNALLNANVEDCDAIIVLSDDREPQSDEKTIRTLFLLKEIADEYDIELDVIAELRNVANIKMVTELRRTFKGTLDYVASSNMRTMLLAQCALNRGLSDVYRQLLTPTKDTCELYTVTIPAAAAGRTFEQYITECLKVSTVDRLIPIGLGRRIGGQIQFRINPPAQIDGGKANPFHTLEEGDQLLVIAYDPPKTSELPD